MHRRRTCVPSIVNTPADIVNDVVGAVPTAAVPTAGRGARAAADAAGPAAADPAGAADARAGRGADPGRAAAADPEHRFGGQDNGGTVPAPPCRKQGLYEFGGERTQYPHVNARGDRLSSLVASLAGAPGGCWRWWRCWSSPARCWRCGCRRRRGRRRVAVGSVGRGPRDHGGASALRRRRGLRARARRSAAARADVGSEPRARARGVPVGERAGGRDAAGRGVRAVRGRSVASKPVRVVYGPGTFINSSVEELTEQLQGRTRERAAQAERARTRRRASWRCRRGESRARGAAAGRRRRRSSCTRSSRRSCWR